MFCRETPLQARRQVRPRASFLSSTNESFITVTGRQGKPFHIHKHLLESFSYQPPKLDGTTLHFSDVDDDVLGLFQWWLYAQSLRTDPEELDMFTAGRFVHSAEPVDILRSRNPSEVTKKVAKEHWDAMCARYTDEIRYCEVLEYARRHIAPCWATLENLNNNCFSVPLCSKLFNLYLRLFIFADKHENHQLCDDIMTIMIGFGPEELWEHASRADLEMMDTRLIPGDSFYMYWVEYAVTAKWYPSTAYQKLGNVPKRALGAMIESMSSRMGCTSKPRIDDMDCCDFHIHDTAESHNCPASHVQDEPFFATFLKTCLEAGGIRGESQSQAP